MNETNINIFSTVEKVNGEYAHKYPPVIGGYEGPQIDRNKLQSITELGEDGRIIKELELQLIEESNNPELLNVCGVVMTNDTVRIGSRIYRNAKGRIDSIGYATIEGGVYSAAGTQFILDEQNRVTHCSHSLLTLLIIRLRGMHIAYFRCISCHWDGEVWRENDNPNKTHLNVEKWR